MLRKGQSLVAIEVKSSHLSNTAGYEKFREVFSDRLASAFIVGPECLPLEDFFALDLNTLFRKAA